MNKVVYARCCDDRCIGAATAVPAVVDGPCDHTATSSCLFNSRGASDSVHRQSRGHLVVQQRLVRGVMAAVGRGFSAALTHFSRSSGFSRS